ncbi:PfkB family carbohydrate kinase [Bosea sp. 124]|uniref:PfkB family carbohydrate kinase n=1 Tax=Bosea sp. 124 TaxID=2135642 RepID=UPI000D3C70DB|nr:PfkB family carbohydrate kinase [Bosea sp. 124]PTM40014.1 ribokinase [Bosea sp. 124]
MADESIFVLGSFVVSCSAKVSRFPRPGESLAADIVTIEPGGKGLNLAVAARRLGAGVDGLLAVGDDIASAFAAPALAKASLPATMLIRLPGKTGSGVGFTDAQGETCLAVDAGVNRALSAGHVREAAARIAAAAMVMAQFEIADEPIRAAFALARQAGVPTLLNPSPFRAIPAEMLADTHVLVLNQTEAEALAAEILPGASAPAEPGRFVAELGPALLALGPELVVLTLGAAGAVAVTAEGAIGQAALQVEAVDSLGAGDAFAATLGVALSRGLATADALRQAAAAGAIATRRAGVFEALGTQADIDQLLGMQP